MIIGIFSITIYFCFIWVFILFNLRIFISCHTNFLFIYLLLLLLGYIHYILIFSFCLFFFNKKDSSIYSPHQSSSQNLYSLLLPFFFFSLFYSIYFLLYSISFSLFTPPFLFFFFLWLFLWLSLSSFFLVGGLYKLLGTF